MRDGNFVAILSKREWPLIQALQVLNRAAWQPTKPPLPVRDLANAIQYMPAQRRRILDRHDAPGAVAVRRLAAQYARPYLMHGSIGPSCAVALFENGQMTVWTHSQGVYPLRKALAQLLRLPIERIRCIHAEGTGCYGHNSADDVAADAALAARVLPGRPVRMQWMREHEHGWEPLGPGMVTELSGALDASCRIVAWRHEVWSSPHNTRPTAAGDFPAGRELVPPFAPTPPKPIPQPEGGGDRNAVPLYAFPNARVVHHFIPGMPLRTSALRGLGAHMNVFSIESFMDELALAAGRDPIAFRLAHLQDPRAQAVIRAAAEKFGWPRYRRRPGRAAGFAFARYKNLGAYCAVALDVEIESDTGRATVHRAVAAVDSGEAVNPDGIRNQIEGGIVQSLSWTQYAAVGFDAHRRTSFDWSEYPIARFVDIPRRQAPPHRAERSPEPQGRGSWPTPVLPSSITALRSASSTKAMEIGGLEARKIELLDLISETKEPAPLLHPNMAAIFRQRISALCASLSNAEGKVAAVEVLRTLVDQIALVPEGDELTIVLRGDLAAILTFASNKKRPDLLSEAGLLGDFISPVSVVAGTRFHLNLRPEIALLNSVAASITATPVEFGGLFRAAA